MQILVQIGSAGTISFDEERQVLPEEKLSDIEGRYLKLKFKNPHPVNNPSSLENLTPIDETLIVHEID